jgi:bacteriocin-like protein
MSHPITNFVLSQFAGLTLTRYATARSAEHKAADMVGRSGPAPHDEELSDADLAQVTGGLEWGVGRLE